MGVDRIDGRDIGRGSWPYSDGMRGRHGSEVTRARTRF